MADRSHQIKFVSAWLSVHCWVSRKPIMDALGLGPAAATKLLRRYNAELPGTIRYDVRAKHYVLTAREPMHPPKARDYLRAIDTVFGA